MSECIACGQEINLREGCEDTGFCDECTGASDGGLKVTPEIPNCPSSLNCYCYSDRCEPCVCGITEKALRGWSADLLPPMTKEQREWCLQEIDSVEGYERKTWETVGDGLLANGVLNAWRDYCRDKGMI